MRIASRPCARAAVACATTFTPDATTFSQAGWGKVVPFDPAHILALQFQFQPLATATAATPYDIWIDDVAFVP